MFSLANHISMSLNKFANQNGEVANRGDGMANCEGDVA